MEPRPFDILMLHQLVNQPTFDRPTILKVDHFIIPQWLFCTYDWILNLDREVRRF